MQNLLSKENILCHLRQSRPNKKDLHIIKLLENVEKHGCESKTQQYKILEEVLQILLSETLNTPEEFDGGIIFSCIILLTYLQEQEKLPCLNESQFGNLWQWLVRQHTCNGNNIDAVCKIITAMGNLLALHPENVNKYFVLAFQMMLKNISSKTAGVLLTTTLQCLNKILSSLKDVKFSDEQCTVCAEAGDKLLQLHYERAKHIADSCNILVLILCTFQILHKIVLLNSNFANQQTAELLGLSKTYFQFGVDTNDISLLSPQRVCISQQALHVSAKEVEDVINLETAQNCGGKTPKTRKPRTVVKHSQSNNFKGAGDRSETLLFDTRTSDSEVSEPESALNRVLYERNRKAKIRLASIGLVGSIARTLDRKTLFGYWHALFPSGAAESNDNLLYIGQHDPNLRCRSAALQVCAHLLYGSKGYLHQAEIQVIRCPKTFVPFSVSLGYTVLAIYKALTTILAAESSLPVLTQALKCLAVLVQASPFEQFEKGFVQDFVKDVKPLVYHRDATIQVSALMVMEFLAALSETTGDIAEAIGLPQQAVRKKCIKLQHVNDVAIDIVDDLIVEFVESEEETCADQNTNSSTKKVVATTQGAEETSWLLKRIMYNLSHHDNVLATSVRIESLQVLIAMSSHFAIIKLHLSRISEVLLCCLKDTLPDVRLYAARCVDACAYQINRYLSDTASCSKAEIQECQHFWLNMMPFIMNKIGDTEETTTVRITLCDALSNIGVSMFEQTPHCSQISLLSFLSGVSSDGSEETLVRAASARALAVFALYPSLRSDFVFIENTAELTLRLVKDSNLLVRVKSFWALGNISDALIGKETEIAQLKQERISDDLLLRLITAATEACSDNDKVRCNAVRTLGNLLRLLNSEHLKLKWPIAKSICKLSDCIRASGNAKVKWNSCYAISNLLRNPIIFKMSDLSWQGKLFSVLCHVIVHHSNFKVRINASAAITNITERTYFGNYYEQFWLSILEAIEQSCNLDNFHEYNHRDNLQEQLCLAVSHIIKLAYNEDLTMLKKHLLPRLEIIRHTWRRVINRMVPEKAAPLLSCPLLLLKRSNVPLEHRNSLIFIIDTFKTEFE